MLDFIISFQEDFVTKSFVIDEAFYVKNDKILLLYFKSYKKIQKGSWTKTGSYAN